MLKEDGGGMQNSSKNWRKEAGLVGSEKWGEVIVALSHMVFVVASNLAVP